MEIRFCGHPDKMKEQDAANLCKWPTGKISWSQLIPVGSFTKDQTIEAISLALSYWSEVANLQFTQLANSTQAMIQILSRQLDGPGNVLAESELPCGNVKVCHQWYDNGENWDIAENPAPGKLDLVRVMAHELGHALGLSHIGSGNLMAPVYNPSIRKPQAGDIAEIQARYGPPTLPPTLPPLPPQPPLSELTILIKGQIDSIEIPGYRITKLVSSS